MARDTRYTAPQVRLSLIAGDRNTSVTRQFFGAIIQEQGYAGTREVVERLLEDADQYFVLVGDKYRGQRNYSLAEEAYLRALEYNVLNSEAHFGLGEAYFWLGSYEQAGEAFQSALALGYPNRGRAQKGLGWSEYNRGNYQAARQHFEVAVEALMPRNNADDILALADAYNGIGWSWLQIDDCTEAMKHFEQALDRAPALSGASEGLALCVERGFQVP
jgi:tetratricopeptide (TPR) repeat protein